MIESRREFIMIIGVPKEIKNNENRVALTPSGVATLIDQKHSVKVETGAGLGSQFTDEDYKALGAEIVDQKEAWNVEMVMKVKEPLEEEFQFFKKDLILFTYLHLAAEESLTNALLENEVTAIAYETVQLKDRSLPLLAPMSEVAGRMSTQIGAQFLQKTNGGIEILLSGVPGDKRGKVTIIGGGQAGTNAAKMAVGLGADVTIIDLNPTRLQQLDDLFGSSVQTMMSSPLNIEESVVESDLVIGSVLIPGAKAPKLVTEDMVKKMRPGSVLVDIAIDQGGSFETSDRITTHDDPTYVKHGVLHYSVANMPGAVPRTSTIALNNATTPYALQLANKGYIKACQENEALAKGLNTIHGKLTYEEVAKTFDKEFTPYQDILK